MSAFIHSKYRKIFDSGASFSEIAIYFRLVIAAGAKKRCSVSVSTLAEWTNCTEPLVRKSTKHLESLGFITVERTKGGSGKTNTYRINESSENRGSDKTGADKTGADETGYNGTGSDGTLFQKTGADAARNTSFQTQKTGNKSPHKKNIYKRITLKEECMKRMNTHTLGEGFSLETYLQQPFPPEEYERSFEDHDIEEFPDTIPQSSYSADGESGFYGEYDPPYSP